MSINYPGNIARCMNFPSKGGLPMDELMKLARSMGIDTHGLLRGQLCEQIKKKLEELEVLEVLSVETLANFLQGQLKEEHYRGSPSEYIELLNEIGELTLTNPIEPREGMPDNWYHLTGLRKLELDSNGLTELPESIGTLTNLTELSSASNPLVSLPESFSNLRSLETLLLKDTKIPLSNELEHLSNLKKLSLYGSKGDISNLDLSTLPSLESLNLRNIPRIPRNIGSLTNLKRLLIDNLSTVPMVPVNKLTNLETLELFENATVSPVHLDLPHLTRLVFYNTSNDIVNDWINSSNLRGLRTLLLRNNHIKKISSRLGIFTNLETLNLYDNEISELPTTIGYLTNLEELNLGKNNLVTLPDDILKLTKLRILDLTDNPDLILKDMVLSLPYLFADKYVYSRPSKYDEEEAQTVGVGVEEAVDEGRNILIDFFEHPVPGESSPLSGIRNNFYFFAMLIYLLSKYSHICVPIGTERTENRLSRGELIWDCKFRYGGGKCKRYVRAPKDYAERFANCLSNESVRFIIGKLSLRYPTSKKSDKNSHANAYIYDKQDNSVEIFEPNGGTDDTWYDGTQYVEETTKFFKSLGVENVYHTQDFCPNLGFQVRQGQEVRDKPVDEILNPPGYCAAWTTWWLEFRLANARNTSNRKALVKSALRQLNKRPGTLTNYIRHYTSYIMKTANEVMDEILVNNDTYSKDLRKLRENEALIQELHAKEGANPSQTLQALIEERSCLLAELGDILIEFLSARQILD